jgi:transcription-repair coupling factor (superfamily II helicase)
MLKFMVISESDIFGKRKKKRRRKVYEGQKIQEFAELKPGDYVVHENHGLGVYQGIEKVEVDKVTRDYMKISYADGGILYILATQMDLIQKYAGADAKPPKLNKLGTPQWNKTKSQVKKAVQVIAQDLVELYAVRQQTEGFVYSPDTVWQKEFEEMFPFEETEDQLRAIEDTKKDMESTKVMDRLICGDVGYGKTEVAIRAAFKAVQDGKQVVYLVPTTILAQQHYNTFIQRLKDFPVRIDLLCRFRTPAQQKKTIEDLKKGLVDIVIGTHRVLSKDVTYKDLGLLIIDEEQRFGVTHKEKIKKMRENIDVLTLTATPIPRTLHMSLIGIRDMSVLEEAPMDRMPIQTYVMEFNDEMIREAIERELSRGGQVYYVYNRVEDIADVAGRVQKLVPGASVSFAHGQMSERELEDIMYDFINGEIDVLVSTTIIETGLDIANANTMIIQDADRFGLSQLYQLRGRVGRSSRMAYAFLLYRRDKLLKEVAEKRLAAIREFTDLGSGIKIAMRDLEIRGAGNLLGEAQSGHMAAVGYDLYCKMLNEAVKELKGEKEEDQFTTTMDLNIDAFIPESYIKNEYQKLDIYKRIAAITTEEEMDDMTEELIDRFGDIPKKVQQLLHIAALKSLAHAAYVTAVEQKGSDFKFTLYEKAKLDPQKIPGLLQRYGNKLVFRAEEPPYFFYQKKGRSGKETGEDTIQLLRKILEDIRELRIVP